MRKQGWIIIALGGWLMASPAFAMPGQSTPKVETIAQPRIGTRVRGLLTNMSRLPRIGQRAARKPEPDALQALNHAARQAYDEGKDVAFTSQGPTVLIDRNNVVLVRNGVREEVPVRTVHYHDLKAISHVALALQGIVGHANGKLGSDQIKALEQLDAGVGPELATFEARGHSGAIVARQHRIVAQGPGLHRDCGEDGPCRARRIRALFT